MTPAEASQKDLVKYEKLSNFSVGDQVRISRIKEIFEKGYLPNWSEDFYIVHEVMRTDPITYILKDINGEIIKVGFTLKNYKAVNKKFSGLKR